LILYNLALKPRYGWLQRLDSAQLTLSLIICGFVGAIGEERPEASTGWVDAFNPFGYLRNLT